MKERKKFKFYKKLSSQQKRIYDLSDAHKEIRINNLEKLDIFVEKLKYCLNSGNQKNTQEMAQALSSALCRLCKIPAPEVIVQSSRPHDDTGELHGLHEHRYPQNDRITVWMRTAKKKQVAAFNTFLRTLIHEFIHHADYHYFKWPESFHTQGFYQRENNLSRSLLELEKELIKE